MLGNIFTLKDICNNNDYKIFLSNQEITNEILFKTDSVIIAKDEIHNDNIKFLPNNFVQVGDYFIKWKN